MDKEAEQAYQKKWRAEHRAEMKEYDARYYKEHAELIRQRARTYYAEHQEAVRAKQARYAAENQDKIKELRKRYYWESDVQARTRAQWITPKGRAEKLIRATRGGAKKRKLFWSLSVDDILPAIEAGKCQVTGISFVFDDPKSPWKPSVDRIDSSKGYEQGNVQIVVWIYNLAKHDYTHDEVMIMARALTQGTAS